MFSDPQFWVAVSFFLFLLAIFNPVRKMLNSSLDSQIYEIKNKIEDAENIKNEAQITLSELKKREASSLRFSICSDNFFEEISFN